MRNPTCAQTHSITSVRDDKRETSEGWIGEEGGMMMCVELQLLVFLYQKLIFLYTKGIFFVCVQIYGFNDIGAIDIDTR